MKDLFNGISDLFVNILMMPFDALKELELSNWWLANIFSWVFIIIGMVAFVYWMLQLKTYNDNDEEDKSISSHSFL
ncbi:uracil phosphoribosyltransferase [uncultured Gelidibacter sp.]|uniref:DUF6341 family protein n=1 Tax=uncultured Gelidibacter sp. TaxID=259318 RepID=UPI0026142F86|nr:uracil phosphoribosyltransferase [uncultured Gelidibacter sp.]